MFTKQKRVWLGYVRWASRDLVIYKLGQILLNILIKKTLFECRRVICLMAEERTFWPIYSPLDLFWEIRKFHPTRHTGQRLRLCISIHPNNIPFIHWHSRASAVKEAKSLLETKESLQFRLRDHKIVFEKQNFTIFYFTFLLTTSKTAHFVLGWKQI